MIKIARRSCLAFFLVIVMWGSVFAQSGEEFEIEGLVLNQTLTTMGGAFYSKFSQAWQDVSYKNKDAITIVERCTGTTGNVISIMYREQTVFRKRIEPRKQIGKEDIRKIADFVSGRLRYLGQNNFPDDLSGDGI